MLKTVGFPSTRTGDQTIVDGNMVVGTAGKGVDFSANPSSPGSTSELLDYYEEGTWTPALAFGAGSTTYLNQNGTFTRIGNQVTLNFWIRLDTPSGASGAASITGLPFASGASSTRPAAALRVNGVSVLGYCMGWLSASSNAIFLNDIQSGTAANLDGASFAASSEIGGTITYLIA